MEKNTRKIEPGTPTPDPKYHLEITAPIWYMEIPLFNKRSSF